MCVYSIFLILIDIFQFLFEPTKILICVFFLKKFENFEIEFFQFLIFSNKIKFIKIIIFTH